MHEKLAAEYGTKTKEANGELVQRMVLALLGYSAGMADRAHVQRMTEEADIMNDQIRMLEASKMEQTISGLERKTAAAERYLGGMVRMAAREASGMDKEALGTMLRMMGQAAKKGLSRASEAATNAGMPKQILSPKHKAQIGLGAAGLGMGYAGAKTLQSGRDFMNQKPVVQNWGSGAPLRHGVNEFGYAGI